ncbi:hypothetical protein GW813_15500 [bacterium]|nr:hypothetical protein [bacterium]
MSSYVYMKVLESTPERYDRGIRLMSGGTIDALRHAAEALAARDAPRSAARRQTRPRLARAAHG